MIVDRAAAPDELDRVRSLAADSVSWPLVSSSFVNLQLLRVIMGSGDEDRVERAWIAAPAATSGSVCPVSGGSFYPVVRDDVIDETG